MAHGFARRLGAIAKPVT